MEEICSDINVEMITTMRKRKCPGDAHKDQKIKKCKSNVIYGSSEKSKDQPIRKLQSFQKSSSKLQSEKKPNWTELKHKKKELRILRRKRDYISCDVLKKAKKLWENVRRGNCAHKNQASLTAELHCLLKGNLPKIVFSHDMSRIIQWLLKLGTPTIREEIVEELKNYAPAMMQSKYSSFCVKYMLKYSCKSSRKCIMQLCDGKVVKLISHKVGSPVFEYMYSTWANSSDKSLLRQEFYGDIYVKHKDASIRCLDDVLHVSPNMKESVLSNVKYNLIQVLNKKMINSSLLQGVMKEFLRHCSKEDRDEIFSQVDDMILDIVNTKDGVNVAMMFIWHATNKTKKQFMKRLKGRMIEIAKSEHGHQVLLALFDVVDDTVLCIKMLLPELVRDLLDLAANEYGRKVVLYLIAHRNTSYFSPEKVAMLKEGVLQSSCKKDPKTREEELLDAISKPLLQSITSDIREWLKNPSIQMVTLAALKSGKGPELRQALEALSEHLCDPLTIIGNKDQDGTHSGIHFMLKSLIRHDKERKENEATFSLVLALKLTRSKIMKWLSSNRSCYILIALMESGMDVAVDTIRKKLQPLMENREVPVTKGWEVLSSKFSEKT